MANKPVNDAVHELQLALLEGVETERQLLAAGTLISKNDYSDVVTERTIGNLCGYPLCSKPLPQADSRQRKGRYRISLKEHKVYDVQEMYLYCSTNCLVNSKAFLGSLMEERSAIVNKKKINDVLRVVVGGGDAGSKVDDDLESKLEKLFGRLDVKENVNADVDRKVEEVTVGAGASDAIEGYVPQHRPKNVPRRKGDNTMTNKPNYKGSSHFNEMDFKSVIISSDEYTISKPVCGSTQLTSSSKLEQPIGEEDGVNLDNRCASGSSASTTDYSYMTSVESFGRNELGADEVHSISDAIQGYVPPSRSISNSSHDKKGVNFVTNKQNSEKDLLFNEMEFTSVIITDEEYSVAKRPCVSTQTVSSSESEKPKRKGDCEYLEDRCATSGSAVANMDNSYMTSGGSTGKRKTVLKGESSAQEVPSASGLPQTNSHSTTVATERKGQVEQESVSGVTIPKSSLKSSGSKKLGLSVTWADERIHSCDNRDLCEVTAEREGQVDSRDMSSDVNYNDADDMLRYASAESCAMALTQAAQAVASGDSDVSDAVSKAGAIILPCPHDGQEDESMEDPEVLEPEADPLKWLSKPGIPCSDFFDPEDSWYDAPPEGFSLTLSTFATMWMAIFSWISSSSLAYIYGRDESCHEDYLSVNGREYPHKIIMGGGSSSEIKQALSGCLARALPGLVADLRLSVPVSTVEKGLGSLLNTMSFIDPLPAFRMKHWQVIAILFLDALSVCRIPALTPYMTNRTMLVHKVLDVAQVSTEEYEIMKDYIMPLGRAPQFSTQSGA